MPCENSVRMVTMCKNDVKKADNLKTYSFKVICFIILNEVFSLFVSFPHTVIMS